MTCSVLLAGVDWDQILEAYQPQAHPPSCNSKDPAQMCGADWTASASRTKKTKTKTHTMKMNKITQRNQLLFALNNNKKIKKKFLPLPDL